MTVHTVVRFVPLLALSVSGCVSYAEVFPSAGTLTGSAGSKPVSLQMSLMQCAKPAIEIGSTCHLPVGFEPGGRAFNRSFTLVAAGAPAACTIEGRRLLVRSVSGKEDMNGLVESTVSASDDGGELVVLSLHGTLAGQHPLDSDCHTSQPGS